MGKTILYVIIGIIVLGIIAFVVMMFVAGDGTPGSIIAVLAGIWASFKAKLFNFKGQGIEAITQQHDERQQDWANTKMEYDSKIKAMQARMDFLEYKSAKTSLQINDLKKEEIAKIGAIDKMNADEKVILGQELINQIGG